MDDIWVATAFAKAFWSAFAEASPPGAAKLLSSSDIARVATIVPADAVVGNGRGRANGTSLHAMHDGVEAHQSGSGGTFVTLRAVILAVDPSARVGFIERVAHRPSFERCLVGLGYRAAHLVRLATVSLLGRRPHLTGVAVVRFRAGAGGGALASSPVLENSAEGLLFGATVHLSAIHLGASEFLAVFEDAMIATVKPVLATLRVLAATVAITAIQFPANAQKLR